MRKALGLTSLFVAALLFAAGTPDVSIHEYDLPVPHSRPHDPAVGRDGALWYTAQMVNHIGRLDPATGAIKEFPLKTLDPGPHGLAADKDGNIWFTANFKAYIGKLDPKTGAVTEYPMPDAAARDPHSLAFAKDGTLFFTAQEANMVGKLDPATGKVTLKAVPTAAAKPYCIIFDPDGKTPWFCEFGSNKMGRIDPATLAITEVTLPEGARPRRATFGKDGDIYYSDYARGFIGHLSVKDGKVEEFPSPGGRTSRPYGIATTPDGMIWYSESGVQPNTLVRFDPKTHEFQKWPIPSGGGVVRNMVATDDGRLYLACSGMNKVAVVNVK